MLYVFLYDNCNKKGVRMGGCDDEEGWIITGKHGTIFVPCFLILKN